MEKRRDPLSCYSALKKNSSSRRARTQPRTGLERFETLNHILVETTAIYSDHYPHVRQQDLVSLKVLDVLVPLLLSAGTAELRSEEAHFELAMTSRLLRDVYLGSVQSRGKSDFGDVKAVLLQFVPSILEKVI
jgi:hypothetical protein